MNGQQGPAAYPISVKGVVDRAGRVLLLKNDRDEWELPGGRLEAGETPEQCVAREVEEETGWKVITGPLLDVWMYDIVQAERHVFIVTYGCYLPAADDTPDPVLSVEHKQIGEFAEAEVPGLVMPQGYKDSIATWYGILRRIAGAGVSRPERHEALARQRERLDWALSAARSVQVEVPGALSPEHDQEVSAYVDGDIGAAELYRRTVERYRRP